DAARIGLERGAGFGVEQSDVAFRGARKSERTVQTVRPYGSRTENLAELAPRQAPQEIQLPETVLRQHIALRLDQVVQRVRSDVRDSPGVAIHRHLLLQVRQRKGAIQLRQRPVDIPPND